MHFEKWLNECRQLDISNTRTTGAVRLFLTSTYESESNKRPSILGGFGSGTESDGGVSGGVSGGVGGGRPMAGGIGGSGAPRVPGPVVDRIRYPDSHQLFVGNLPLDATEQELKDFFSEFGPVLELRINTKGAGPTGQKVRSLILYVLLFWQTDVDSERRWTSWRVGSITTTLFPFLRYPILVLSFSTRPNLFKRLCRTNR